uniref:V-type proton ATPase proteolipid subunit n=1 Tax=Phaeocystis antarctica TaxID=33657 RepID=A0A7S0EZI0_9EUKA
MPWTTVSELEFARAAPDAPFWGFMGAGFALIFANIGAAYGTGKSGMGISALGVAKPELVMKSIVPIVMAGVLGIYGLIIAVIIANDVVGMQNNKPAYTYWKAFSHFGGGMACGLSGLAAGLAIGIVGDSMTRASAEQPKLFVGMVLILIFAEALGLYGLIVGLVLASKASA